MNRETYIIDRETNTLMLKSEWLAKQASKANGLIVLNDIQPYKNVVDGKMITSRSHHRNFLKKYNLYEVGNEKPKPNKFEPMPAIRPYLEAAWDKLSSGRK